MYCLNYFVGVISEFFILFFFFSLFIFASNFAPTLRQICTNYKIILLLTIYSLCYFISSLSLGTKLNCKS